MSDLVREQNAALRAQNNAPSWRDCEGAGLRHLWRHDHTVGAGAYYKCQRCPVRQRREAKS